MKVELILPWPPKELSPNARVHWAKRSKAAKAYRNACFVQAKQLMALGGWQDLPATGDLHLWLDFYPPNRRSRDDDNLTAAFKAGRDGLADALGFDDRRFRSHPYLKEQIGGMVKVRITTGP